MVRISSRYVCSMRDPMAAEKPMTEKSMVMTAAMTARIPNLVRAYMKVGKTNINITPQKPPSTPSNSTMLGTVLAMIQVLAITAKVRRKWAAYEESDGSTSSCFCSFNFSACSRAVSHALHCTDEPMLLPEPPHLRGLSGGFTPLGDIQ
mmetsp:Transcript_35387/g.69933  ORF Transcript_35387/g.69933 Transcript_35387/m.69933 type:complete len:149 (-) Transcript_35387:77-523(-)